MSTFSLGGEQGNGGEGRSLFLFLIPLFSNRMFSPPHPDSVGCVCISVPASTVENNIVKGNQPSVSVLVWGKKLNVAVFVCYGILVPVCLFYSLDSGSMTTSDGSQMCKVMLWVWGGSRWPGFSTSWLKSQ